MFARLARGLMALLLASAALGTRAAAQNTITLEGVVTAADDGQTLSGAQLTVTNILSGEKRLATTRATGEFRMLGLFSGRYEVTVRLLGYKPAADTIQLVLGQRARLAIAMEKGAAEITGVTVSGTKFKAVEVQRLSVSAPILKEEIENLPLNARGIMNLAGVAPGIRSYAPQQGRALPSAGGAPDLRFINLYMDGVEMKSLFNGNLVGIPQTGSPIPQEGLEEFRVYLNPYDAEYTRAGSYVISAVSRRGGNKWEGSGFGFFQNADAIARTYFQRVAGTAAPNFGRQQFGANLRGPLMKDKLFLSASYEGTLTDSYIDVIPTTAQWANRRGSVLAPQANHTLYTRVTAVPNDRNTIDFMWSSRILDGEGNFGGRVSQDGGISQKYFINTGQLRHRWLPSTNLVNEASLQLVQWNHNEDPLLAGPQRSYPGIVFGTATFPLELRETHLRFVNRATYNLADWGGSHLLKAGVELARVTGSQFAPNNRNGAFTFPTDTSTLPNAASVGVGFLNPDGTTDARAEAPGTVVGLYFNDEWRPVNQLTVNIGLRWDAEINTLSNDFNNPWAQNATLQGIPSLARWLNRGNRRNDMNNFSPRLSFSWDPTGQNRTFVRGGYAIMFDRVTSFIGFQERLSASWRTYNFVNPGTTDVAELRRRVAAGVSVTPSPTLVKDLMQTPENRQWSVGVGHQFTPEWGLNADWIQQSIHNLYVRQNPNFFNRTANRRELTPAFGDIVLWDDFGRAKFRALISQLTYNKGRRRLNLAYTLSWNESEFDGNLANVFPLRSSYQMQTAAGDERHRLVVSAIQPLPWQFLLSTITTLASPRSFAVTDGRDLNNNNVFFDDFIGGTRTLRPDAGSFPNWYRTIDLRLARPLYTRGAQKYTLTLEVFNALNWNNWSTFGAQAVQASGAAIASFQRPTNVFAARQTQLGVRAEF
jgi:hypothetical protein